MTRHLIGFLGTGAPTNGEYRQATYRFKDGFTVQTAFFGIALFRWLSRSPDTRPDRLTLLGTKKSMWGALYQLALEDEGPEPDLDSWDVIAEAVARDDGIDSATLERAEELVSTLMADRGFGDLQIGLRLIPYGTNRADQVRILQILAEDIDPKDRVWMDLTHGFRHLPMLGLLSALHLRHLREVRLEGIYYGALEMTREHGYTPVLSLKGLLDLADWVTALSRYEASGDCGELGAMMVRDGLPKKAAHSLARASFLERSAQFDRAVQPLLDVRRDLDKLAPDGPSALFTQELRKATRWANEPDLAARQRAAAARAMDQGRFVAAATAALEALVTEEVLSRGARPDNYHAREEARRTLHEESKDYWKTLTRGSRVSWEKRADDPRIRFHWLNQVRNALAHGPLNNSSRGLEKILKSDKALRRFMTLVGVA